MSDKNSNSVESLLALNVSAYTEKKGRFTYLSWSWAWTEALKQDPKATYEIRFFGDKCFMDINGTAMVFVTTTLFGKAITCQLAVMDHNNRAIKNPDAFALNNSIMRCLVKSLALHGLGLYLYAGEDLPEDCSPGDDIKPKNKSVSKDTKPPVDRIAEMRERLKSCESLDVLATLWGEMDKSEQKTLAADKDEAKARLQKAA